MAQETDPLYTLTNGTAILVYESEELYTTNMLYSLAMPTLDVGKRYMYRVQAIDPTGNNLFRNDGFSPNSWFYYGYPQGGKIENLEAPKKHQFKKNDPRILAWKAPDNLINGQNYNFKLKVVEIADEQSVPDQDEFAFKPAWFEKATSPTSSTSDYSLEITKEFETQQWYAWYVTAYTGQQAIAESEVWTFRGPALLNDLKAGIHTVYISELENENLDALKGKGTVKIFQTDTDSTLTEVAFENLKVKKVAGRFVLESGEIRHTIQSDLGYELAPRTEGNGQCFFRPTEIKLDKDELSVNGYAEWDFPHPINGSETKIKTEPNWVNFHGFRF
jgi:hypothetical protein